MQSAEERSVRKGSKELPELQRRLTDLMLHVASGVHKGDGTWIDGTGQAARPRVSECASRDAQLLCGSIRAGDA